MLVGITLQEVNLTAVTAEHWISLKQNGKIGVQWVHVIQCCTSLFLSTVFTIFFFKVMVTTSVL